MSSRQRRIPSRRNGWRALIATCALGGSLCAALPAAAADLSVSPEQRGRAQHVAQAGVPLSELADNAPSSHTVQRGDTLWDISKLFLKSPWRWPDLWGMNLDQIRNPHLIYPGQRLVLDKSNGRATLRIAGEGDGSGMAPTGTVKLSPSIRSQVLVNGAIASIPLHLIGPFLNDAIVLSADDLAAAPRIVATQEGRVMVSKGETAYVRGDLKGVRDFQVFRQAKPLIDPATKLVLGYEGTYVGSAEFTRAGYEPTATDNKDAKPVPASIVMKDVRLEGNVGDRLSPSSQRNFDAYVPHPPTGPMAGQIVSVYGEALMAGQNQIVAINRGTKDGAERGHVLALWRDGEPRADSTGEKRVEIKLPDEQLGLLFVFRVFDRVSYALVLRSTQPVSRGDRFSQP